MCGGHTKSLSNLARERPLRIVSVSISRSPRCLRLTGLGPFCTPTGGSAIAVTVSRGWVLRVTWRLVSLAASRENSGGSRARGSATSAMVSRSSFPAGEERGAVGLLSIRGAALWAPRISKPSKTPTLPRSPRGCAGNMIAPWRGVPRPSLESTLGYRARPRSPR